MAVAVLSLFWNIVQSQKNMYAQLLFVILSVLLVGLVWEVYEFGVQDIIKATGIASIPDSISDLVFDTLGGIVAFFVIRYKTKN